MPLHEIQRLLPRHFQIMELDLGGVGRKQIAEMIGVSEQTVYILSRSPLYISEFNRRKAKIDDMMDQNLVAEREARLSAIQTKIERYADKAVDNIIELVEDENVDASTKLRGNISLLDKVFGSRDKAASSPTNIVQISGCDVQLLVQALKESEHARPRQRKDGSADNGSASPSEDGEGEVRSEGEHQGNGFRHRRIESETPSGTLTEGSEIEQSNGLLEAQEQS